MGSISLRLHCTSTLTPAPLPMLREGDTPQRAYGFQRGNVLEGYLSSFSAM